MSDRILHRVLNKYHLPIRHHLTRMVKMVDADKPLMKESLRSKKVEIAKLLDQEEKYIRRLCKLLQDDDIPESLMGQP